VTASDLLLETARRGELHHALLLFGPAPQPLRKLAHDVAKTLNCLNGTTGDDCTVCQRIERRIHPDVHMIEVGGERKMISVEQIREVVAGAGMRPYEGRNKVFIIDPADALSPGGSNSLLKTLEEPASDTTFILLTRSPDILLPTIRSRCQMIYLGGVVQRDAALAGAIDNALSRFAGQRDTAVLLSLAAVIASDQHPNDALALLGEILCEDVARPRHGIPPERLLAAAAACVEAIRWLPVNADVRMVTEGALAHLVM
jgi:DNA polymerase III gamma/tau subunit